MERDRFFSSEQAVEYGHDRPGPREPLSGGRGARATGRGLVAIVLGSRGCSYPRPRWRRGVAPSGRADHESASPGIGSWSRSPGPTPPRALTSAIGRGESAAVILYTATWAPSRARAGSSIASRRSRARRAAGAAADRRRPGRRRDPPLRRRAARPIGGARWGRTSRPHRSSASARPPPGRMRRAGVNVTWRPSPTSLKTVE